MTYGFGEPDTINYSSQLEQWVYRGYSGSDYVYFRYGRVYDWQL